MAASTQKDRRLDDPADWVDQYGDVMLNFALARIGRREVAEDLVQETFLAAWRARDTFDGLSQRSTWLIGILRRKIADHFRAGARVPAPVAADQVTAEGALFDRRGKWVYPPRRWTQPPDKAAENAEFWHVLADCMSEMPGHLSQAFHLREIGLANTDEICRLEGITPKNLSVRLHRARLLLRQCLERSWFCNK
jgi:RNA polymerase sigma-70 factor, ECF subfamily